MAIETKPQSDLDPSRQEVTVYAAFPAAAQRVVSRLFDRVLRSRGKVKAQDQIDAILKRETVPKLPVNKPVA